MQRAVRLLRLSDQIKFARRPAEAAEAAARIAETRDIAAAVEGHLAPLQEAAASAPPAAPVGPGESPSRPAAGREGAA